MAYAKEFMVEPGSKARLAKVDASYTGGQDEESAKAGLDENLKRLRKAQYQLYANNEKSLLIVLQGLDAAGKDGVIRNLFSGLNPQGTSVAAFKQPAGEELVHDFLWRAHIKAPGKGQIVIFNRSYYEDVVIARVHDLVPEEVWSKRYALITSFEKLLRSSGTEILKFYLHISAEEQLVRFKDRLEDPMRQWKISESDYTERQFWPDYIKAYDHALALTSTKHAPWFVIPSNHKWFRNLAISQIVAATMEGMKLRLPPPRVDLDLIRREYAAMNGKSKKPAGSPR